MSTACISISPQRNFNSCKKMSTASNQNKPSGYINISAAIKARITCCNTTQQDVSNNKVNHGGEKIEENDSNIIKSPSNTSIDLPITPQTENEQNAPKEGL